MKVVYMAKNIVTNDRYIGVDSYWPKRKTHHTHLANKGEGFYFHRAIRKYGIENFEWIVLEVIEQENLYEREMFWIEKYNPEYNMTSGGEGRTSLLTEEHKQKISKALIDNKNGLYNKAMKDKNHTNETKESISLKMKQVRKEKQWSTKKKDGDKTIKGGISDWSKEQKAENARKIGKLLWWNNGIKNIRSNVQPEGFVRGRVHK